MTDSSRPDPLAARSEREERYRALFDATDEGFCVIEVMFDAGGGPYDYRFLELNDRFVEQTGLENAAGRTARELVPNLEQHWFDTYGAVALGGEPVRFENRSEEMGRWFDVYAFPVGGEASRRVGILFKDITDRKRAELALEALNEDLEDRVLERTRQVRELAAQLTLAEAKERARLAQVLHNDLQQQLYAVQFTLRDVRAEVEGASGETRGAALASLDEAARLLQEAVEISRTTTTNLSPPVLRGDGLAEALRWLAEDMRARHGLEVEVEVETRAAPAVPAEAVRVLLFELVRELLFNVVKHAGAEAATVTVFGTDGGLAVRVRDLGRGFDPADPGATRPGTGLGLTGVRRRLELFGGRLDVEAAPGEGACVTVWLPAASLAG